MEMEREVSMTGKPAISVPTAAVKVKSSSDSDELFVLDDDSCDDASIVVSGRDGSSGNSSDEG